MHEILKSFWVDSSWACTPSPFIIGNFLSLSFPGMYEGWSKQTHEKLWDQVPEHKGHKEQLSSFNPAGIIAVHCWFSALQSPTGAYIPTQKLARFGVVFLFFISLFLKMCSSLEKWRNRANAYSLLTNYQVLRCRKLIQKQVLTFV